LLLVTPLARAIDFLTLFGFAVVVASDAVCSGASIAAGVGRDGVGSDDGAGAGGGGDGVGAAAVDTGGVGRSFVVV
jgi:hypothetical protein